MQHGGKCRPAILLRTRSTCCVHTQYLAVCTRPLPPPFLPTHTQYVLSAHAVRYCVHTLPPPNLPTPALCGVRYWHSHTGKRAMRVLRGIRY
eukprot:1894550-Rhodomonas_salina.1